MIAIQNSGSSGAATLEIVDAYYDIRSSYNSSVGFYAMSGYSGQLPVSIQNLPEEQAGAVYNQGGTPSLTTADYDNETAALATGITGSASSIFITRNGQWVFAAEQTSNSLLIAPQGYGQGARLSLPDIYRVSVAPGGSVVLAFALNSPYVYYPRQLTATQSIAYSGGYTTWPKAAVDCEPLNAPNWCLFQAESPDHVDSTGNTYGAPLVFDHPDKAVFSADGSIAYVLNCGPECGGTNSSISLLPTAPMLFPIGQESGLLPTEAALSSTCTAAGTTNGCTIAVPNGASNALVDGSLMYVVGQKLMPDGYWGGYMTRVNLSSNTLVASTGASPNPVSISDGIPGGPSRLLQADDNTLWIAMTKCTQGERYYNPTVYPGGYGCLTMYNTSTNTVTMLEPYIGDATGIADVEGLHKIYTVEGGQVYIYKTTDGTSIDNQYVTVTGTASDVAYMDGTTDANNTYY